MKAISTILMALTFAATVNAQSYNVGTSTTSTDYYGNQRTTHCDQYGNTIGTSTTSTDYYGNRRTQQRSNNSNTSIWSW